MITVRRRIAASPDLVFAVLSDGWNYAGWVVGASRIRSVDPEWPEVGSRIHHSVGIWPALINDSTSVLESEKGRRLVLQARGWPAGEARVEVLLEPDGDGCLATMNEDVSKGPGRHLPVPVRAALLGPRNTESLRRLALMAENRPAAT